MEIETSFTVWECVGSLNDLGRVLQLELIKLSNLDARGMPELGDGDMGDDDKPKKDPTWWITLVVRLAALFAH